MADRRPGYARLRRAHERVLPAPAEASRGLAGLRRLARVHHTRRGVRRRAPHRRRRRARPRTRPRRGARARARRRASATATSTCSTAPARCRRPWCSGTRPREWSTRWATASTRSRRATRSWSQPRSRAAGAAACTSGRPGACTDAFAPNVAAVHVAGRTRARLRQRGVVRGRDRRAGRAGRRGRGAPGAGSGAGRVRGVDRVRGRGQRGAGAQAATPWWCSASAASA